MLANLRADLAHELHQGCPAVIGAVLVVVIIDLGSAAAFLLGGFS